MTRVSICGHSMGGHGAKTFALKHPGTYRSVSVFSPICAPADCPRGHKAVTAYLGADQAEWQHHDASALIRSGGEQVPLLVDQEAADTFFDDQLIPDALKAACDAVGFPLTYREHDGFDHSYFLIASFMEEHLRFHAKFLHAE